MNVFGRIAAVGALGALVLAGCARPETPQSAPVTTVAPTTTTTERPVNAPPAVKLTPVANGVAWPTALAQRPDDDTLYVATRAGDVLAMTAGVLAPEPVLHLVNVNVSTINNGLLGLTFDPSGKKLFVYYTAAAASMVDEYTLGPDAKADLASGRNLLTIPWSYANHFGGGLAFGPDGDLYVGTGDGGTALESRTTSDPKKSAQNLTDLHGKILRIDPSKPSGSLPYTAPFDNPFTKQVGAAKEVWAFGLADPRTISFDSTGALWVTDNTAADLDEVNMVPKSAKGGDNYAWPLRLGTRAYEGSEPTGAIEPVWEHLHGDGRQAVVGGGVYGGAAIPDLSSRYVFGDSATGQLSTLTLRNGTWQAENLIISVPNLTAIGHDRAGELYVLSKDGTVSRIDPV